MGGSAFCANQPGSGCDLGPWKRRHRGRSAQYADIHDGRDHPRSGCRLFNPYFFCFHRTSGSRRFHLCGHGEDILEKRKRNRHGCIHHGLCFLCPGHQFFTRYERDGTGYGHRTAGDSSGDSRVFTVHARMEGTLQGMAAEKEKGCQTSRSSGYILPVFGSCWGMALQKVRLHDPHLGGAECIPDLAGRQHPLGLRLPEHGATSSFHSSAG